MAATTDLILAVERAFPAPSPRQVDTGRAQVGPKSGCRGWAKSVPVHIGGDPVTLSMVAVPSVAVAASKTAEQLTHSILFWCSQHLASLMVEYAAGDATGASLRRAGRQVFQRAQAEAQTSHPRLASVPAACTLVLCALNQRRAEVTTCNSGSCVALMASAASAEPILLSKCHRVQDSATERARVEASGCRVAHAADESGLPCGPLLVWPGGHETARCIGSLGKGSRAQLPLPSCATVPLPPGEVELLLGSASVLDEIHVSSALALLRRAPSAQMAAQLLVEAVAVQRHSYGPATDNDAGALRPRTVIACAVLKVSCPPPGQPASALKPSALHGRSRWSPLRPRAGSTELGSPMSSGVSTPPPASASPPPSRIVSADLQVAEPTVLRVPIDDNNSRHGGSPPPAHSLFSWRPFRSQQA